VEPLDLLRLWAGLCALSLRQLGLCAREGQHERRGMRCKRGSRQTGCGAIGRRGRVSSRGRPWAVVSAVYVWWTGLTRRRGHLGCCKERKDVLVRYRVRSPPDSIKISRCHLLDIWDRVGSPPLHSLSTTPERVALAPPNSIIRDTTALQPFLLFLRLRSCSPRMRMCLYHPASSECRCRCRCHRRRLAFVERHFPPPRRLFPSPSP
jgi:hypothetical protein